MKLLMFAALLAASATTQAAENLQNVLQCARANIPANLSLRKVVLETTDRAKKVSTVKARIYAMREAVPASEEGLLRAMMHVDAPEYLEGAAYLVRETNDFLRDGMFVYLPSVGRVRRVTGGFTDGALMGTKFSYFEFKQLTNAFRDLTPQLKGSEKLDGRDTNLVKFTPLDGAETRYTSVLAWIDQKSCLPIRADFKEGDMVVKRLSAPPEAIAKVGDNWYLKEINMRVLADDTHSVMRVKDVSLDEQISDYYFDPETFYTVQ